MPKIPDNVKQKKDDSNSVPDNLKPYLFHGLDLKQKPGEKEATGECPFCNKDGKFSVDINTSKFKCWSCGESGNSTLFLRKVYEESNSSVASSSTTELKKLAAERGLMSFEVLLHWGVCRSFITGEWIVPGYGVKGEINQLYRYVMIKGKRRLLATPSLKHQLFGLEQYSPDKDEIHITEGPWDGMALWEILFHTKAGDNGLEETANVERNLLRDSCVISLPGCNVFNPAWESLFADKVVNILFDNDHPRKNKRTGAEIDPAGFAGMKRLAGILSASKTPPRQINFLKWGEDSSVFVDMSLPDGCDLRDYLTDSFNRKKGTSIPASSGVRRQRLSELLDKISPVPDELLSEAVTASGKGVKVGNLEEEGGLECLECTEYKTLINVWKRAMKWTDGLETALSAMLASVTSTMSVGDQLWLKILGPASCGKSTLCEALSVNKRFVLAKSTIRGFHSGWKSPNTDEGGEEKDSSLAAKAKGKTLVIKDGDTLLQAPNLGQILSEARDIYDRTSRTDYRNEVSRNYEGLSMTWILCGTAALRLIDSSELGARFLDCTIMEGIDSEFEDDVLFRVAHRTDRNLSIETDADPTTQQDPDMTEAMQLTGGYVTYLRENAQKLLSEVVLTDKGIHTCIYLGKFIAYMRARPSLNAKQEETASREFGARLVSQLVRLSKCTAVVMNRKVVDAEVLKRTRKIALDTARGITLNIARRLYETPEGFDTRSLAMLLIQPDDVVRKMLRFLAQIHVIESYVKKEKGVKVKPRWRLKPEMRELLSNVIGKETEEAGEA